MLGSAKSCALAAFFDACIAACLRCSDSRARSDSWALLQLQWPALPPAWPYRHRRSRRNTVTKSKDASNYCTAGQTKVGGRALTCSCFLNASCSCNPHLLTLPPPRSSCFPPAKQSNSVSYTRRILTQAKRINRPPAVPPRHNRRSVCLSCASACETAPNLTVSTLVKRSMTLCYDGKTGPSEPEPFPCDLQISNA